MSVTAVAYAVAAALYTGFQWTIRVVVYPQFARAGREGFTAYERHHQRLVSVAVGPLFVALGVASLAVAARPPAAVPRWEAAIAVVLDGAILIVTAVMAVPLHGRLEGGFDEAVHRRLLSVDSIRLGAAVGSTALGVAMLLQ